MSGKQIGRFPTQSNSKSRCYTTKTCKNKSFMVFTVATASKIYDSKKLVWMLADAYLRHLQCFWEILGHDWNIGNSNHAAFYHKCIVIHNQNWAGYSWIRVEGTNSDAILPG